jgi:hypothetical protein
MHNIAHLPEPVGYCYFSCETPSLVPRAPARSLTPLAPRFGVNHHGHSESSTRGKYSPFSAQT